MYKQFLLSVTLSFTASKVAAPQHAMPRDTQCESVYESCDRKWENITQNWEICGGPKSTNRKQ